MITIMLHLFSIRRKSYHLLTLSTSKFGIVSKFGHTPKNGTWPIAALATTKITSTRNIVFPAKGRKVNRISRCPTILEFPREEFDVDRAASAFFASTVTRADFRPRKLRKTGALFYITLSTC